MSDNLLSDIALDDSTGMRFAKLQRWLRYQADQAGIGYTIGGLLDDIALDDSEGMRFAKLQRWLKVIANGGGGGGGIVWVTPPTTATSTGTAGQVAYDAFYFYVCVSQNSWVRTPLSSW